MLVPFKEGKEVEWIELNLLLGGEPISKASLLTASDKFEENIESWLSELEFRIRTMGSAIAPYSIEHGRVKPLKSWLEVPEYLLCAFYSYHGAAKSPIGTRLFERISGAAVQWFISGKHVSLGFPSGVSFNTHLDNIAKSCSEHRMNPAPGAYKDDGVDVFVFKSFDDMRPSNFYVLMQCAAGIHWRNKGSISLNRWCNYINWYRENIVTSLATTDVIPAKEWNHRTSDHGLLMDRLRIYRCLYSSDVVDAKLRKETIAWCKKNVLKNL